MFRIIHISDLHFDAEFLQSRVIAALCADILVKKKEVPISAVVFSGDAAAKGQTDNENIEKILAQFISNVRDAVGVEIPFLICPGNHDVNIKKRLDIFNPVFNAVNSPAKANELVKAAANDEANPLWTHLDGFKKMAIAIDKDAFAKNPIFYTKKVCASGLSIGFACFNSAWMTKGGGSADYGSLYIGEYALEAASKELNDVDLKIAVIHHPLDWLAPEEKSVIQRFLTLNFHALLCGHKHDNNADTLNSNIGSLFTSNTGCVYHSLEYFNGYSIIDIDLNSSKWIVSAREYFFQRNSFGASNRFSDGGSWEVPFASKINGLQIAIPGDLTRAINDRANSLLLSYSTSDVAPKSMGALFVEPPLSAMSEKELIAKTNGDTVPKDAYVSLDVLGKSNDSIFFLGKREAGKSLLLHHIAVNRFQLFKYNARIGVVVDLHAIRKITEASILEQGVEFCGGEILKKDLISLLSSGEIVICFDNLKIHDQKMNDLIFGFLKKYPLTRYVFSASEELLDNLSGNKLPEFGVEVLRIFVHSFRAKHTKELVKKWFGSNDVELDKRILNVNQLLSRLRVPRTPFLVSVLSWVLEQRPNANVINRASAIEVLIEGLLEKFKEPKLRKDLDSKIQQHFLTEFALHLNELDVDWINRINFDEFTVNYFKTRGLNNTTDGFSAELIRKGLLFANDDRVGFKFDCFRAFFLARKFSENSELWMTALQAENVSKYGSELDLFTGLHRDRSDVLLVAKNLCEKTAKELEIDISLDAVDSLNKAEALIGKNVLASFENESPSNIFLENYDDSVNEAPDIVSADHEESRRRVKLPDMGKVGRFLESLRIFSVILRNSELINDLKLKRESFELAIEQWANTLVVVILESVEESNSAKSAIKNGDKSDSALNRFEVATMSKAIVPQMISSIMCESLATPKLELFVREKSKDVRTLVRVLAVFLSFDGDDDSAIDMAKGVLRDFKSNNFIIEMMFFKFLGFYLYRSQNNVNLKVRELLGDIFVQMGGGTFKNAALVKSRFLNGIDKNLLMKDYSIINEIEG